MTYERLALIEQIAGRLEAEKIAARFTAVQREKMQRMVGTGQQPRGFAGDVWVVLGGGLCGLVWGSIVADALPNIMAWL